MTQHDLTISVASGKGGTGKTTLATNLAAVVAGRGRAVTYMDCDVEEPNGALFLKPDLQDETKVCVPLPQVDQDSCTLCGDCSAACEYNAIAVLGPKVQVFSSLCHGCGGCTDICPEDAIHEVSREIGVIRQGRANGLDFLEGRLNVGEPISPPVTRALKHVPGTAEVLIIDAPPGTSCPVIEAIAETDFVILVTEPTPFGLNDLRLAVGMVRELGLPHGVVINRADIGDHLTEEYCRQERIDILARIPFNRKIAEAYSRGGMMCDVSPEYDTLLSSLFDTIANRIDHD